MKRVLLSCLSPLVLIIGLSGNIMAHQSESHEKWHPHKPMSEGGLLGDGVMQTFRDSAGLSFANPMDFRIVGGSSVVSLVVTTLDLEAMTISIFNKKSGLSTGVSFSFEDSLDTNFTLDPGKYFALFTGKISDNLATYSAAASAVPVPEPAEWMMILAGVAMMGVVVSRRRKS